MSIPKTGPSTHKASYPDSLLAAINQFLPCRLFHRPGEGSALRWTERYLVLCVLLFSWSRCGTLAERFDDARKCLLKMFPGRRRPGGTYRGFIAALTRSTDALLQKVSDHLRGEVQARAGDRWSFQGFIAFGADGSKVECPKTFANQQAFGCAGKKKSTPQQFLTTLLHLPSGLPWDFTSGPACSSERAHLQQMLGTLPQQALLVADAGFTGYQLLGDILQGGREFLIRVGSNVRLLRRLGLAVKECGQTVYLWPADQQHKNPPLVLRLITLVDGRNRRMHLLSSVRDQTRLTDQTASQLYTLRWGVELYYRSLKQTLARRKLAGDSPATARIELRWSMIALWLLCLLGVKAIAAKGRDIKCLSVAGALRCLRRAMHCPRCRCGSGGLTRMLGAALLDDYVRAGNKQACDWAHKKKPKRIGQPKARNASAKEVLAAQRFVEQLAAA